MRTLRSRATAQPASQAAGKQTTKAPPASTKTKPQQKAKGGKQKTAPSLHNSLAPSPPPDSDTDDSDITLPSPTISEGPDFDPPRHVSQQAIVAARTATGTEVGKGFSNKTGVLCFRNAVIVTLLHSNRIISWIRHEHIPNLKKAGLTIQTYSEPLIRNIYNRQNGAPSKRSFTAKPATKAYTDVWCELHELSNVYWDEDIMDQDDLDEAMGIFWDYLLHPQRLKELKQTKTAKKNSFAKQIADKRKQEEHCVREFLDWLIELSGMQLDFFYKKDKSLDVVELTKHQELKDAAIEGILEIALTQRLCCSRCRSSRNVKIRVPQQERMTTWINVPLGSRSDGSNDSRDQKKASVTVEDCLREETKIESGTWKCYTCQMRAKANIADEGEEEEDDDDDDDDESQPAKSYIWKKIWRLPEVLILQLNRFKKVSEDPAVYEKDFTHVEIATELDLSSCLETRGMPTQVEAKYRLVAIVNHFGDTTTSGHYKANILDEDGAWFCFDDEKVRKTQLKTISRGTWVPYVLLYEKIVPVSDGDRDKESDEDSDGGKPEDTGKLGTDKSLANKPSADQPSNDKIGGHGDEGTDNGAGGADGGDGGDNDANDAKCPVCGCNCRCTSTALSLPTCTEPPSGDDPPRRERKKLQLSTETDPRPGQVFLNVSAKVNEYDVSFPTFVLADYRSRTADERAEVTLELSNSEGRSALVRGSALIQQKRTTPPVPLNVTQACSGSKRKRGADGADRADDEGSQSGRNRRQKRNNEHDVNSSSPSNKTNGADAKGGRKAEAANDVEGGTQRVESSTLKTAGADVPPEAPLPSSDRPGLESEGTPARPPAITGNGPTNAGQANPVCDTSSDDGTSLFGGPKDKAGQQPPGATPMTGRKRSLESPTTSHRSKRLKEADEVCNADTYNQASDNPGAGDGDSGAERPSGDGSEGGSSGGEGKDDQAGDPDLDNTTSSNGIHESQFLSELYDNPLALGLHPTPPRNGVGAAGNGTRASGLARAVLADDAGEGGGGGADSWNDSLMTGSLVDFSAIERGEHDEDLGLQLGLLGLGASRMLDLDDDDDDAAGAKGEGEEEVKIKREPEDEDAEIEIVKVTTTIDDEGPGHDYDEAEIRRQLMKLKKEAVDDGESYLEDEVDYEDGDGDEVESDEEALERDYPEEHDDTTGCLDPDEEGLEDYEEDEEA